MALVITGLKVLEDQFKELRGFEDSAHILVNLGISRIEWKSEGQNNNHYEVMLRRA